MKRFKSVRVGLGLATIWSLLVGLGNILGVRGYPGANPSMWHTVVLSQAERGWVWIAVALVAAVLLAFWRVTAAAVALSILPLLQATSYAWGFLMWLTSSSLRGYAGGWFYAAYYSLVAVFVAWAVAQRRGDRA